MIKPVPVDKEIKLDPTKIIMSKTDPKGIILYTNEYFLDICGYLETELMGKQHNVIRHPDMPRVVFKMLWDTIKKGEHMYAFVKNLAKDGRYYWVVASFETKFNEDRSIQAHYSKRKPLPAEAVKEIEKIYKILLSLEKNDPTMVLAENYLVGMLEENAITYEDFILSALNTSKENIEAFFDGKSDELLPKENKKFVKKKFVAKPKEEKKEGFFSSFFK